LSGASKIIVKPLLIKTERAQTAPFAPLRIKKTPNQADMGKTTKNQGERVSISSRTYYPSTVLGLLGLCVSLSCAASDLAVTYGGGSDRYQSYAVEAGIDVPTLPLQLDLDYTHIRTDGAEVLTQTGVGLSWKAAEWASGNYRFVNILDRQ
jgi:hypothetical protein